MDILSNVYTDTAMNVWKEWYNSVILRNKCNYDNFLSNLNISSLRILDYSLNFDHLYFDHRNAETNYHYIWIKGITEKGGQQGSPPGTV